MIGLRVDAVVVKGVDVIHVDACIPSLLPDALPYHLRHLSGLEFSYANLRFGVSCLAIECRSEIEDVVNVSVGHCTFLILSRSGRCNINNLPRFFTHCLCSAQVYPIRPPRACFRMEMPVLERPPPITAPPSRPALPCGAR